MIHGIILIVAACLILAGLLILRRKRMEIRVAPDSMPTGLDSNRVLHTDPREVRLEHSADTLRSVLVTLIDVIRNTDSAAGYSAVALNEARVRISNINVASNLQEADALLAEIDRVISSNSLLRKKLNENQEILREQQGQIESLKTEVRVDALTQLGNRAAFEEQIAHAVERFERYQEHFSLLLFDIDHFKAINDTYGHPAGDRVLKGLALKLKAALRGSDLISRYGGEEFVVILLRCKSDQAMDTAEKVRDAVETLKLTLDKVTVKITVSIGVAEAMPGESKESLIARADAALYQAKQRGRNRVSLAPSVVE